MVSLTNHKDEFELEIDKLLDGSVGGDYGILERTNVLSDLDIVFYSQHSYRLACKALNSEMQSDDVRLIRTWIEPKKKYFLIAHNNGRIYGLDLMLGYVVAGEQLIGPVESKNLIDNKCFSAFINSKKNKNYPKPYLNRCKQGFYKLWNIMGNAPLPWFVFLGPDGAGKTTILESATQLLKESRVCNLRVVHLREPLKGLTLTDELIVMTKKKPHSQKIRTKKMSLVKLAFLIVHYRLVHATKLYLKRRSGTIVVFDRYVYDLVYDSKRFGMYPYQNIYKKVLGLFPRPDMVFIVTADAQCIVMRKNDLNIESATELVNNYREDDFLVNAGLATIVYVDSGKKLDDSVGFVQNKMHEKIMESI